MKRENKSGSRISKPRLLHIINDADKVLSLAVAAYRYA
jgi:hypothetical protein